MDFLQPQSCLAPHPSLLRSLVASRSMSHETHCALLGQIERQHTTTILPSLQITSNLHISNTNSCHCEHCITLCNASSPPRKPRNLIGGQRSCTRTSDHAEPITWDLVATAFSESCSCSQKCAQPHAHWTNSSYRIARGKGRDEIRWSSTYPSGPQSYGGPYRK
jgi:hypothetical protein